MPGKLGRAATLPVAQFARGLGASDAQPNPHAPSGHAARLVAEGELKENFQKNPLGQPHRASAILVEEILPQLARKHRWQTKGAMTREAASLYVQQRIRGNQARKKHLHMSKWLNLQYEIKIIEQREERRRLVSHFLQHMIYMAIMVSVFLLQHGHTVGSRYSMVAVLKQYVHETYSSSGVTFESIRTIPDVWEWTEALIAKTAVMTKEGSEADADKDNQTETADESLRRQLKAAGALGAAAAGASINSRSGPADASAAGEAVAGSLSSGGTTGGRVFIRTYNQLVGTVRIETLRVDADSCAYKNYAWAQQMLSIRRPALWASDTTTCYGSKLDLSTTPYGPWYDKTRWEARGKPGFEPRYIIDLGKDPNFARLKIAEARKDGFLSQYTRRVVISFVIYNNALPLFCYCRLVIEVTPTGEFHNAFHMEGMNVQEYTDSYWWVQVVLELLLVVITIRFLTGEVYECYEHLRGKAGICRGFLIYLTWSKIVDFFLEAGMILVFISWAWLVLDNSRDVDLDVQSYVDLEYTASIFQLYNFSYNVIVCVSLFSLLQYSGLDDRIALVSRLIGAAMSDLVPFLCLFISFVIVYGLSGHFLYGPVLKEWSTHSNSFVTAMDIVMGNYLFTDMEEGIDTESASAMIIAFVFYYSFSWMMMLLLLNVVIAILMDGYAAQLFENAPLASATTEAPACRRVGL